MRVTQSSMSRNYLKALNNNLYNYNASSERLQTGLKLNKVSDNTADAAKAFAVREQIYKKEQALDGIRDAVNELTTAEGALMSVNDVYKKRHLQRRATRYRCNRDVEHTKTAVADSKQHLWHQTSFWWYKQQRGTV